MSIPIWMLLGFSTWTITLLLFTVGIYRWSRILTGRAEISSFRADEVNGKDWYKRAMRAHANCVENLPVFAAIVFVLYTAHIEGLLVDSFAIVVMIARIAQSIVHVSFIQTNKIVAIRFSFFFTQLLCFLGLIIIIMLHISSS